ncbi:hypothetical protein EDB19DRAFT_347587 [Suillus lakei]|nr:hypothetical protein EDB19DRAFT_347587 [Suillus lakei]
MNINLESLPEVGFQNYYQLLVDNSLISQSQASQALEEFISPSAPDYHRCPVCSHRLLACSDCSSVICNNDRCAAANLIRSRSICQSCLSTLATSILAIAMSNRMCSQNDCRTCAHFNGGVICPDCVKPMDGHIVCPCGETWVCGTCATWRKFLDNFGSCPKCQNYFCFSGCKYIDACPECQKVTLCNDCMELEDEEDGHMPDEGSSITNKDAFRVMTCGHCQRRICADCFDERKFCCGYCATVRCQSHMSVGECLDCGAPMCWGCEETRQCQECRTSGCLRTHVLKQPVAANHPIIPIRQGSDESSLML